jgi:hypothetical protein
LQPSTFKGPTIALKNEASDNISSATSLPSSILITCHNNYFALGKTEPADSASPIIIAISLGLRHRVGLVDFLQVLPEPGRIYQKDINKKESTQGKEKND